MAGYPSTWPSDQARFNHGSMFWLAGTEGLLVNASTAPSVHAGLRTRLSGDGWGDHEDDSAQNWVRISADDIDDMGTAGVIKAILDSFATAESAGDPVYLSVDIDVLDPGALAPIPRDVHTQGCFPRSSGSLLSDVLTDGLKRSFRPGNRHPRTRRLDHPGADPDSPRHREPQPRRRGRGRGCAGVPGCWRRDGAGCGPGSLRDPYLYGQEGPAGDGQREQGAWP